MYDKSREAVEEARSKESVTAEQAATLRKINLPSQDPHGWALAKEIKDELSVRDTLTRNANLAKKSLEATEQIFKEATEFVERAYELGLAAIYKDEKVKGAVRAEVKELYESLIHTLNTRYGQRTLLAGFKAGKPAFDQSGNYLGDNGRIEIEVEHGNRMPINVTGESVRPNQEGDHVDIPGVFLQILEGLKNNDDEAIGDTFDKFHTAVGQLTSVRTEIGAKMNRIDRALDSHEIEKIGRQDAIANIEEADPVRVFTDLARDQTALKASLDTTYKLLNEVPPDKLFR